MAPKKNYTLLLIVVAQFAGTSLWFAGNAILPDLIIIYHWPPASLAWMSSAVQAGFILGTLLYAFLNIADRFSPSKVFLTSAIIAAFSNLAIVFFPSGLTPVLVFRFFTGFFLAGIYPVGMKIAADYYKKGLGLALGFLVGALVVGTAFPQLLRGLGQSFPWQYVLWGTSALSIVGAVLLNLFVGDGPNRVVSNTFNPAGLFSIFKNKKFRAVSFAYFGHMWELYAFWAFLPFLFSTYFDFHSSVSGNAALLSFSVIAIGGPACVIGAYFSKRLNLKKVAFIALSISGLCCLFSPIAFSLPFPLFLSFLLIWGMAVVADSPLFSTLIANNASRSLKATALSIVNSIGFAITIVSIQLLNSLSHLVSGQWIFMLLAIGPALGLWAIRPSAKEPTH